MCRRLWRALAAALLSAPRKFRSVGLTSAAVAAVAKTTLGAGCAIACAEQQRVLVTAAFARRQTGR
jgi:hypothetical protein